ncbi:hypothetical protein OF829_10305 [Sphingomonas sp. LB-2]|uniref:hypothetical protein n=1 Tax=Sphingomonas caeni TaxID=2984949 RepID=UPI002231F1F0|nr:hypothetical protein [Sphingomonas caeni]MCW3847635.1 hypothetical protein [Sphingomonas caeni]
MSGQAAVNGYVPPAHQREVDAMLAEIRAQAAQAALPPSATPIKRPLFREPPPRPTASNDPIDFRIAEELDTIRRRLDQIGDALIGDPILLHRHAMALQGIDLTNQILAHLAEVIKAADKAAGVEAVKMDDLRARLKRQTGL